MVPPRDALRYQQAGSQPKTVRWYPAGHQLPFTAMQYQTDWLFEYTGAQELLFLRPHFSATALWLDRLLGIWVLLVVASLLLLLLDGALATPWTVGGLLSWALVVLFTGPLGLLVYAFTWRQPLRRGSPGDALSTAWRALGATAWVLAWVLLGVFITIVLVLNLLDLFNKLPWLNILLSIGIPFVSTVLTCWYGVPPGEPVKKLTCVGHPWRCSSRSVSPWQSFIQWRSSCSTAGWTGISPLAGISPNR